MKKIFIKLIVFILFLILFITPIYMIKILSQKESQEYVQNKTYNFGQKSYGEPMKPAYKNVKEYYEVSGKIVSDSYKDISLVGLGNDGEININFNVDDEIQKDNIIYKNSWKEIKSQYNGIIKEINTFGTSPYVRINTFEHLLLSCELDKDLAIKLKKSNKLKTEKGKNIEINFYSNVIENNKVKVILDIKNNKYTYGDVIEKYKVYTGVVYNNALTLPKKCVYKKDESNDYYIRIIDDNGNFKGEKKIKIGYETNEDYCVTGVDENESVDSGYKNFMTDNQENGENIDD